MIILDTNVLSGIARPDPDPLLLRWLDRQPRGSVWSTSITLFEIHMGLELLPQGRRRTAHEKAFRAVVEKDLEGRILDFDAAAATVAAGIAARRRRTGTPCGLHDTQIAGIATARRGAIATRNVRHFGDLDIPVIDPWA